MEDFEKRSDLGSQKKENREQLKKRILVAEADEMVGEMTQQMLQSLGYEVELVRDGETLLEKLYDSSNVYDLVISDFKMGDKSGLDVFNEIHQVKRLKSLPFMIMTGDPGRLEDEMLLKGSKVGFISKPFTSAELGQKVESLLNKEV